MTSDPQMDPLSMLLQRAAQDLADRTVPPVWRTRPVPRWWRRRAVTGVLAPVLVAACVLLVVLVARGPGRTGTRTDYAGAEPELGRVAVPAEITQHMPGGPEDPLVGDQADLLATTTTKDGQARLLGLPVRSGRQCLAQDYRVPFQNSSGGTACTNAPGETLDRGEPLTVLGGHADGTPGRIKDAPVLYGVAPPGTRAVELSAPGLSTRIEAARDGGKGYAHRAYWISSWPFGAAVSLRALDAQGQEIAHWSRPASATPVGRLCRDASGVLFSHLQGAVIAGQVWARTHPASHDNERLGFPHANTARSPDTASGRAAIEALALTRYRLAQAAIGRMGPVETYEYRMGAVVVLGDGRTCSAPELQAAARTFLNDSAGAAPLPSKYGRTSR